MKVIMIAAALLIAGKADSVELKQALYGTGLVGQQVRIAITRPTCRNNFYQTTNSIGAP
jgi:ribosomal protein S9